MKVGQLLRTGEEKDCTLRMAVVLEVQGCNAGPPFLVRWLDTGREDVVFPDNDFWPVDQR